MIKLYWYDDSKRLLIREMDGCWTWDEYYTHMDEVREMICSVSHPVVVLVDYRNTSHIPKDALKHISIANQKMPSNISLQVIVSENRWLEGIASILNRFMPESRPQIAFVRTMEKAQKKIKPILNPPKRRKSRRVASPIP